MSDDILDALKAERDRQAEVRRAAFAKDDVVTANAADALCVLLFRAMREIEESHVIIGVMKDVMVKRIVEAAVGDEYRERFK